MLFTNLIASILTICVQAPAAPAQDAPQAPAVAAPAKPPELPGKWGESVRYHVSMDIKNKMWSVWMGVTPVAGRNGAAEPFEFWIPRWVPGGYHLVEFAKFVESVEARDEAGNELKVTEESEPRRWKIEPGSAKNVMIHYVVNHSSPGGFDVNALDMEANRINKKYGFINSTSLFGFVPGMLEKPAAVKFELPENWKLVTAMTAQPDGTYTSPNYYRLEDSPVFMSPKLLVESFEVDGIRHEVAVYGRGESDLKTYVEQCTSIVRAGKRMMGKLPYDRYTFMLSFSNDNTMGGGLEHSYSTLILLPASMPADETLHVLAHEYFHLWNAERIHVDKLQKPDYTKPLDTGTIWLNEGGTEYFSFLLLTQAGLIDQDEFYKQMAEKNATVHAQLRKKDRKSIVDVSRKWSANAISGFTGLIEIQYGVYERGAVTCFALDLHIRNATNGAKGLTDVLRYLMTNYVEKNKGYGEDELPDVIKAAVGVDARDFYNKYVAGPELPDLDPLLATCGLKMNRSPKGAPAAGGFHDLDEVTDAQKAMRAKFFAPAAEK